MKVFLLISAMSVFLGCRLIEPKLIRKKIQTDDVTLMWYYYSYISSGSPDIIDIEKDGEVKEIYRGVRVVLDVVLKKDTVLIKLVGASKGYPITKKVEDEIFGYRIVLDTIGIPTDLNFIPKGIKE